MPTWVSVYFAGYVTFTLWSLTDDIKNKQEHWWFTTAEIISDLCLLIAAFSFWLPSIRAPLAQVLLGCFAVGVALFLAHASVAFRRQVIADPELPLQGKLFVGLTGSALVVAISAPLLWWGFNAAVLNSYAGT